jgi:cytochrome c peroxidase
MKTALRNIAVSAPYMHDPSVAALDHFGISGSRILRIK